MKARHLAVVLAAAAACSLDAATNTWSGAVNDWNWDEEGNYADGKPAAGDVLLIPAGTAARLLGDDSGSLAVASGLERIIPEAADSRLTVEADAGTTVTLGCAVSYPCANVSAEEAGFGEIVKTGGGELVLSNTGTMAYCTSFTVAEGSLRLPVAASPGVAHSYNRLSVSNGATLYTVSNRGYTYVKELSGSGLVTNDSASECYLQVWGGTLESPLRLEAKLAPNVRWYCPGVVDILSEDNTMTAASSVRRVSRDGALQPSMTGLAKIGNSGTAGSLGTFAQLYYTEFGGGFRYLGTGEKTTKALLFTSNPAASGEFDGGPYGNLEFASTSAWASRFNVCNLVLSGSNALPCTVSADISQSSASSANFITLTKRGTGAWRLAHNAKRAGLAGVSVEEGTLQVESIMEKGEFCALGPATNCYPASYCGSVDPSAEVGYSIALGSAGAESTPLFELVGTNGAWTVKRGVALFGDARMANSATNAAGEALPMRISGISAATAGRKTLFLEGGRNGDDSVGMISDGAGTVAVVKTGEGTWALAGTNTFTGGLVVSNGTLEILSPSGTYTWYRWNLKSTKNGGGELRAMEFALFDAGGARVNGGLRQCPVYSAIRRGEAAVERQTTAYYGAGNSDKELYNLFNDTTAIWHYIDNTPGAKFPKPGDPESWYRVLMRLPAGAAAVASYDVVTQNGASGYAPAVWSLEASVDGTIWDEIDSVDAIPFTSAQNQWAFGRSAAYSDGAAASHTGGRTVNGSTNKTEQAISPDCPVSVAGGATLKCVGSAVLSNLRADFGTTGTLSGFSFAASGVIDVLNMPAGGGRLPLTFADTDAGELAKIAGWTLLRDGDVPGSFRLLASGGSLHVSPVGTVVLIK